jgi:hypothetical protein
MSVDTKVRLFGAPSPQQIAAALRSAFDVEVDVRASSVEDMFHILFPDPADISKGRKLTVFPDYRGGDDQDVFSGRHTYCMLGAWGSSVRIADALASRFGGYVCESDSKGDWRLVEADRSSPEAGNLSPEGVLKIELEKIVGHVDGVALARIAADEAKLEGVIAAYAAYRAATGAAPAP